MSEYDDLLAEARAKAEAFRASAKAYIPNMWTALRNENSALSAEDARDRIQKDCINIWSRRTILEALPDEAKNPEKQKFGRLRQKKRNSAAVSAAPQRTSEVILGSDGDTILSSDDDDDRIEKPANSYRNTSYRSPSNAELIEQLGKCKENLVLYQSRHNQDTNRIAELETALKKKSFISADEMTQGQSQSSQDFEFPLQFEVVRRYMELEFKRNGGVGVVWFHGTIDPRTGKITNASTGRIG